MKKIEEFERVIEGLSERAKAFERENRALRGKVAAAEGKEKSERKSKKSEELIFEKFRVEQDREVYRREVEEEREKVRVLETENKELEERLEEERRKTEKERE